MVLFIILAIILVLLIAFIGLVFTIGGTIGIIIFSDVIVCIFILWYIIKKLFMNR